MNKRALALAGARVDDEAGGLADDDHLVVRVHDGHVYRRVRDGPVIGRGANVDLDDLAFGDTTGARGHGCSAQPNPSAGDEVGDVAARQSGQERHQAVDPLTIEGTGDDLLHFGCSVRAWPKLISTSNTHPTVMAASATLKTGHQRRSTKSITDPRPNPGDRKTRSTRLPTAPPSTSPSATATAVRSTDRPTTKRTITRATTARTTMGTTPDPSP